MFHRSIKPSNSESFFIFGARGTGKSTFIQEQWGKDHFYINLLEDRWESRYLKDPDLLGKDIEALAQRPKWIVIDEVQKVPKLLDIVHSLIESKKLKFVLTGSSARKLKRPHANLLAGRAFQYHLHPLTHLELGKAFDLEFNLNWGSLPKIFSTQPEDREEFLRAYTQTYLREEILQEQLVRGGAAFRNFLEVAAQTNGQPISFAKLGTDLNVDTKTVQNFFQILEDTLVGFFLPAWHRSARKSVKHQPKFYIFDLGVKKAMERSLAYPIPPQSSLYGQAFEHFLICEVFRLNSYSRKDYQLSHYQTTAGGEIDLILHRGREVLAVEIKSSKKLDVAEVHKLARVAAPLNPTRIFYVSQDEIESRIEGVHCLPWQVFLSQCFG